jgi:hypothetical protein
MRILIGFVLGWLASHFATEIMDAVRSLTCN